MVSKPSPGVLHWVSCTCTVWGPSGLLRRKCSIFKLRTPAHLGPCSARIPGHLTLFKRVFMKTRRFSGFDVQEDLSGFPLPSQTVLGLYPELLRELPVGVVRFPIISWVSLLKTLPIAFTPITLSAKVKSASVCSSKAFRNTLFSSWTPTAMWSAGMPARSA